MLLNPSTLRIHRHKEGYALCQEGEVIETPAGRQLTHASRRFIRYMRAHLEASQYLSPSHLNPFSLYCTQKDFVETGHDLLLNNMEVVLEDDLLLYRENGPEQVGQFESWSPVLEFLEENDEKLPRARFGLPESFVSLVEWQYRMLTPAQRTGVINLRKLHKPGVLLPMMLVMQRCSASEYAEALLAAQASHPRIFSVEWDSHLDNYIALKDDATVILEYLLHYETPLPAATAFSLPTQQPIYA